MSQTAKRSRRAVYNMALPGTLLSIFVSLLLTPFLLFLLVILFLASIGKSIGVRRLYVRTLLTLFEYGRQHIEIAIQQRNEEDSGFNSEDEGDGGSPEIEGPPQPRSNGHARSASLGNEGDTSGNGVVKNGLCATSSLISRDALVLAPDPNHNRSHRRNTSIGGGEELEQKEAKTDEGQVLNSPLSKDHRRLSFETLKREFELADCLAYVTAGMEAIIEDEVTQCFQAEELKSWNLLTRTNRHYEFISWRLTVIWMLGFLVRYCLLLPLRVIICFIGMSNMVACSLVIALVPNLQVQRWLNKRAMLVTFRLFARALSAVITFHDVQYAPHGSGICVANHTTPVDIVMLATENDFSLVYWLTFCTAVVGYVPAGPFKRWLNHKVSINCFGVLSSALSAVITYHNPENKPQRGICVANHTSPIDVLVLACDNCYALIGQRHGGFLGLLQRALARASSHIWFERSEVKDREFVTRRLREHVSDPNNPPILIFPEGTCINNTSVMQFKKGSFEVGGVIYPVAIKYDPKFGDAFWNSSEYSMMQYLYMMMTSWAIVCDVWYLPPMQQEEGESAIDFANRVKSVIATQGGLVDLMWDGQLKRVKVKKEWKERQQEEFSKRLKVE